MRQNKAKSTAKVSVRESKMCLRETPSPASNIYFVFLLLFALFELLFYIVSLILDVPTEFVTLIYVLSPFFTILCVNYYVCCVFLIVVHSQRNPLNLRQLGLCVERLNELVALSVRLRLRACRAERPVFEPNHHFLVAHPTSYWISSLPCSFYQLPIQVGTMEPVKMR